MAGFGHLYVTAHGDWPSGAWAGETAQIGLRFSFWSESAKSGPVLNIPDNGPVGLISVQESTTDYNVTRTFDFTVPGPGQPQNSAQVMDDIVADFKTFLTNVNSFEAAPFRWTSFKIAPIELGTGRYLAPASIWSLKTPQAPSSTSALPPECAIAVSFRAPVVGRRGRGRFYVPALNTTSIELDGKVKAALRTSWAGAAATLARDLANLPGLDTINTGIIICSGNSRVAVVPTEARIGDHVDVQRRRQHQVDETYTTVAI